MTARAPLPPPVPLVKGHVIHWFVYESPGGHLIPRTASMRGTWPGYEAKCSCGWETRTGGAVRSWIEREVADHKLDVELGFA